MLPSHAGPSFSSVTFVTLAHTQWKVNGDNFLNWILNCETIFINCVHNGKLHPPGHLFGDANLFVPPMPQWTLPLQDKLAQLVVFAFEICQIDFLILCFVTSNRAILYFGIGQESFSDWAQICSPLLVREGFGKRPYFSLFCTLPF